MLKSDSIHVLLCSQLDLSHNDLCGVDYQGHGTYDAEGITALAKALRTNASLTSIEKGGLNLNGNRLGDEGWGAIFAGVCSSSVSKIASIDASNEHIGSAGAARIGQALRSSIDASELTNVS